MTNILAAVIGVIGAAFLTLVGLVMQAIKEQVRDMTEAITEIRRDLWDHLVAHGMRPPRDDPSIPAKRHYPPD